MYLIRNNATIEVAVQSASCIELRGHEKKIDVDHVAFVVSRFFFCQKWQFSPQKSAMVTSGFVVFVFYSRTWTGSGGWRWRTRNRWRSMTQRATQRATPVPELPTRIRRAKIGIIKERIAKWKQQERSKKTGGSGERLKKDVSIERKTLWKGLKVFLTFASKSRSKELQINLNL